MRGVDSNTARNNEHIADNCIELTNCACLITLVGCYDCLQTENTQFGQNILSIKVFSFYFVEFSFKFRTETFKNNESRIIDLIRPI